ncbi:DHA2 family efflux MFS transporter permease subunit [Eupransor demetentiae]|uniref:MFS family (AraJ) n=1 Tax=Eupransor demetentiae TaxID=3109584 RepID=A0ABP0ER34_9LACO|nr:MFS family (AraJ) [Lactobacillaceae bacterium LMG 33000]
MQKRLKITIAVMVIGAFMGGFSSTLMNIALPNLMRSFHISVSDAQWITTGYMLISALVIPASSYLIKKYSMRTLYLTFASIFMAGSILGFVAPNFFLVVVARMIQAAGAGVLFPLVMVAGLRYADPHHRGMVMGLVGMVFNMAPIIGPTISGMLLDLASWRYLFAILVPIIALTIVAAIWAVPNDEPEEDAHLNVTGLSLLSFALGTLLYGLSNVGQDAFVSWQLGGSLLAGVLGTVLFIRHQRKSTIPVIDFRIFKDKQFNLANSMNFLLTATMFANSIMLTLMIQQVLGLKAITTAWVILPGALLTGFLSPISGRLYDHIDIKKLTAIGLTLDIIGTILQVNVKLSDAFWVLLAAQLIRQFGLVMILIPIQTQSVRTLPAELISDAVPAYSMFRQIAASLGTALIVGIIAAAASIFASNPNHDLIGIKFGYGLSLCWLTITFILSRGLNNKDD